MIYPKGWAQVRRRDTSEFSAKIDGREVMNTRKDPSDRQKFYVEPYKAK